MAKGQIKKLSQELGLPELVVRVLAARGYQTLQSVEEYWWGRDRLSFFHTPLCHSDLARAVQRIHSAVRHGERIAIYGDYDCDGITASALLARYLTAGYQAQVEVVLPNREVDGYGIYPDAVKRLAGEGISLIITVDNGIGAQAAALAAKQLGVDLIVTDHHQPPTELPDAYAIINPKLDIPALADLAGVGVAFLLAWALHGRLDARLEGLLDVVALGTIADAVPLTGINRSLVWAGLRRINASPSIGLKALMRQRDLTSLSAHDVAFRIAPILNAAGRMAHPRIAYDCLMAKDEGAAQRLAVQLSALNEARRRAGQFVLDEAEEMLLLTDRNENPFLVLAGDWPPGVTGIAAGQLAQRYQTPVLLLSPHQGAWRGSARAPLGISLEAAWKACRPFLLGGGGHHQAAGCQVSSGGVGALREALNQYIKASGWSPPPLGTSYDLSVRLDEIEPCFTSQLRGFEPCGAGNPPPRLALVGVSLGDRRRFGTDHLSFFLQQDDARFPGIWWGGSQYLSDLKGPQDLVVVPEWTRYRGMPRLRLVVEGLNPLLAVEGVSEAIPE